MRNIFTIIFFPLILYSLCSTSQITFQKTYRCGVFGSYASSVKITSDGGYVITGGSFDSLGSGIFILKVAASGDTIWSRIYHAAGGEDAASIVQSFDGGYAVCGNTASFPPGGNNTFLLKVDSLGNLQWLKKYETGFHPNYPFSLIQKSDSGFAISGTYDPTFNSGGAVLIQTDKFGNTGNLVKYGSHNCYFHSLDHTINNGFIFSGTRLSIDLNITKRNQNGFSWSKNYNAIPNSVEGSQSCIRQTSDGGYIVSCDYTFYTPVVNRDICLLKIDSLGMPIWSYAYGGTEIDGSFNVEETIDGGFIVSGYTESFGAGQNKDIYVIKVDSSGSLQWSKTYGGAMVEGFNTTVQQTADNGYIIGTSTTSFNSASDFEIYLIKTDPYGNSGCNELTPATIVTPVSFPGVTTQPLDSNLAVSGLSETFTLSGITTIRDLCLYDGYKGPDAFSEFSIFPNPATGKIKIESNFSKIRYVNIFNLLGEKVYATPEVNCQQLTVNCEFFPAGIYFIIVQTDNGTTVKKLVKQ